MPTTKPASLDLDSLAGFTPGPWYWLGHQGQFIVSGSPDGAIVGEIPCQGCNPSDGPLIAAAPALLAECHRLRAENERLREALKGAASGLAAMLNSADVVAASQEGDEALMQAITALEPQS